MRLLDIVGHKPKVTIGPNKANKVLEGSMIYVPCPHCPVGKVGVLVESIKSEQFRIPGLREPRVCPACGKKVKLQIRVTLSGIKLED